MTGYGAKLDVVGLQVDLAGRRIVESANLAAGPGEFIGLVGPNGSGKSTLLRAVFGAVRPAGGEVRLDDLDMANLNARSCARQVAVVLQDDATDFSFTVRESVGLGRIPHLGVLGRNGPDDVAAVADALGEAGVDHLADRRVATLSGGERQRVFVARALAQRTPLIILDEPTNHLDIRAQIDLLELLRGLRATVVAALHDLNLAAAYCDRIYVLSDGQVEAGGPPHSVLTPTLIERVYGVQAAVSTNPLTGRPALSYAPFPVPVMSDAQPQERHP